MCTTHILAPYRLFIFAGKASGNQAVVRLQLPCESLAKVLGNFCINVAFPQFLQAIDEM
jgi:hypothetical protein